MSKRKAKILARLMLRAELLLNSYKYFNVPEVLDLVADDILNAAGNPELTLIK